MLEKYLQLIFVGIIGSYLSHFFICVINQKFRKYVKTEELNPAKLTQFLGGIERLIYAFLFLCGKDFYTYIATFFVVKVAYRLVSFSRIETPQELQSMGERRNIYLLCNIFSLIFSILLIGFPAQWVLGSPIILDLSLADSSTFAQTWSNTMKMTFEVLLTIYSIFLVFVMFCFQEINNKIRQAQDKFRQWCINRKELLGILGINRDVEAWLDKDLIFHLYDFKRNIENAKSEIKKGSRDVGDKVKEIMELACDDYYNYLYRCYLFKNKSKLLSMLLIGLLIILKLFGCLSYVFVSYSYVVFLFLIATVMLLGPEFDFKNNPMRKKFNELSKTEQKEIKDLEGLVREI